MNQMQVRAYDNQGQTIDRYTIIIGVEVYAMSQDCLEPTGVNSYLGNVLEMEEFDELEHIPFTSLPEQLLEAVYIRSYSEDFINSLAFLIEEAIKDDIQPEAITLINHLCKNKVPKAAWDTLTYGLVNMVLEQVSR